MIRIKHNLLFIIFTILTLQLYAQSKNQTQMTPEMIQRAKSMGVDVNSMQSEMLRNKSTKEVNTNTNLNKTPVGSDDALKGRELTAQDSLYQQIDSVLMNKKQDKSNEVFGRDFFSSKNVMFEPSYNIATPQNYVLGPGDEVIVDVWGDSELNFKGNITPDGTIFIESVGQIRLAGLTALQAEALITTRILSIYSSDGNGSKVSFSLGKMRSIKVNIAGEAMYPGTYTLPSLATVLNALYAARGVSEIGSLRDIKIYRNNLEVASLDLYDYLLNGKLNSNIRLQDNDMIIVSPYDSYAKIKGKVKRNRIYEMKQGETLNDIIRYSGGFTGDAFSDQVNVIRKNGSRQQIFTVDNQNFPAFLIQDGDSIAVDSTVTKYINKVSITGAVWRPGNYELSRHIGSVKDLVMKAEGVKGDAFPTRAYIKRLREDFTYEIIPVNIIAILNGKSEDVILQNEDEIFVPSSLDLKEKFVVTVKGEVNNKKLVEELYKTLKNDTISVESQIKIKSVRNGDIEFNENMSISDAIIMSGGLKESASESKLVVSRRIKDTKSVDFPKFTSETFEFTIDKDLNMEQEASKFILEPYDIIFVRRSPAYQEQKLVKINGEVLYPGEYSISTNSERLSDLIVRAGGVNPLAYIAGASLTRKKDESDIAKEKTMLEISSKGENDSIDVQISDRTSIGIDLRKALSKPGSFDDIVVMDGDEIMIPVLKNTVEIGGAVLYPNSVTFEKDARVKDYIMQAGGYVDKARKRPYVVYMNGKVSATRNVFFVKRYPKVEPGCMVVVPMKSMKQRAGIGEIMSIMNSTLSMAAMATSIIK